MLKGPAAELDLVDWKNKLLGEVKNELTGLDFTVLDVPEYRFEYPVLVYPEKVSSLGLDKNPSIKSKLVGIKGQYLIFESGVFNVRAHTGYDVTIEA